MMRASGRQSRRESWADLDGSDISSILDECRRSNELDGSELDGSAVSRQSYTDCPMQRRSSWGDLDAVLEGLQNLDTSEPSSGSDEEKPRSSMRKCASTCSFKTSRSSTCSLRSSATRSSRSSNKSRRSDLKRKVSRRRSMAKDA